MYYSHGLSLFSIVLRSAVQGTNPKQKPRAIKIYPINHLAPASGLTVQYKIA